MTTFRIVNPFEVFFDLQGRLAAGGSLKFYDSGTTTPRDVYADKDKAVNNGSTIAVGSDGRATLDAWGEGSYRMRLYDVDGTLIQEADPIEMAGAGGLVIPALEASKFLTNDGANLLWQLIRQLPDPSGNANKIVGTDGSNFIFYDRPDNGSDGTNADVTVHSSWASIGNGSTTDDKLLIQSGTVTLSATGTPTADKHVDFSPSFKSLFGSPMVISNTGAAGAGGYSAIMSALNVSNSGFQCHAEANAGQSIINNITASWIAIGSVAP